ncbi:MAG: pyruvate dehydrogenase complex dihydrolipoamide acetyltransferase [Rhodobacteraceae bacterium]|nr:pyruvate dehydrogenase complex dihydrolipoamide acetyltransferase [Paracoccaceae bacterium]
MATTIRMPALSPTMEEGTLAKWLVREGDAVEAGDLLAEIETDKAVMEFEATDEGLLAKILVAEGTAGVKINTPIAIISEEGEELSGEAAAADVDAQSQAPSTPKDPVDAGQPAPTGVAPATADRSDGKRIFASPLARRLARDNEINLAQLKGTGPRGRIVKRDIEQRLASRAEPVAAQPAAEVPMPTGAAFEQVRRMYEGRSHEVVELDGMRRTVAARLTEAKQTIPHFYLRRKIRIDRLLELRARINGFLESRNVRISINDYVILAIAKALQEVPDANVAWADGRMIRFDASDVAVAVAVEGGLFTPVILDAESKSVVEISAQMKDLAARARERRLKPHEYVGGSCTISNLGMFGIENFDAVINPPHGSILAVGKGARQPVYNDEGQLVPATLMSVTLSVDHRVIDGAIGARFLDSFVRLVEEPLLLVANLN